MIKKIKEGAKVKLILIPFDTLYYAFSYIEHSGRTGGVVTLFIPCIQSGFCEKRTKIVSRDQGEWREETLMSKIENFLRCV